MLDNLSTSNPLSRSIMWTPDWLDRIKKVLQDMWNPQNNLKVFHVWWTNGKGSVCAMLSQVLYKQFHKKVLTFCSPHIIDIKERWLINWKMISEGELSYYEKKVILIESGYGKFGFFEVTVMIMLLYAIDQEVDYLVCEVGIGGLLDPTNVFHSPLATFTTSISMDHVTLLGPSIVDIQYNKMWIMKSWTPHYTRINNQMMYDYANFVWAILHVVDEKVTTNMLWEHQLENAWLVYRCLVDLGFDKIKVSGWLMDIEFFGRLTEINRGEHRDGAHNIGGLIALSDYLVNQSYQWLIVVCNVWRRTEEIAECIRNFKNITCFIITNHKFGTNRVIIPEYIKADFNIADPLQAYSFAKSLQWNNDLLLVCGSFYLLRALSVGLRK